MRRCKVIVMGSGKYIIKTIEFLKTDKRIELLGAIGDLSISQEVKQAFDEALHKLEVPNLKFADDELCKADLIFVCEYRRVISKGYVYKYHFVNCHGGILPKYKGFSANPWAIMNGESEIGYTIHRMDEKFDHGDIYYVGRFNIGSKQTYADVYEKIFDDMVERICDILFGIYCGMIKPEKQKGDFVYCSKFYKEMGNLKQFAYLTSYIWNLYRCMARPHGTGIYFWYKGRRYYVGNMKLEKEEDVADYICIPGRVVNCEEGELWVKTKDNVIVITQIVNENGDLIPIDTFHIGNQLGERQ